MELDKIDFLNGVRRCGHVRWFVMNHYKARTIGTSTNYAEFHEKIDPNQNPFMNLNYLDLPDPLSTTVLESEQRSVGSILLKLHHPKMELSVLYPSAD